MQSCQLTPGQKAVSGLYLPLAFTAILQQADHFKKKKVTMADSKLLTVTEAEERQLESDLTASIKK
jgi:hypothetical protein